RPSRVRGHRSNPTPTIPPPGINGDSRAAICYHPEWFAPRHSFPTPSGRRVVLRSAQDSLTCRRPAERLFVELPVGLRQPSHQVLLLHVVRTKLTQGAAALIITGEPYNVCDEQTFAL